MAPTQRLPKVQQYGEDFLSDVEDITITLEGGKVVTLNPKGELAIPDDADGIRKAAERGPARLAFWGYQMERSLARVRDLERELNKLESQVSLMHGLYLKEEEQRVTDAVLRERVSLDDKVDSKRKELSDARTAYGFLRCTRDAIEHRMYVLRKLLVSDTDANRS